MSFDPTTTLETLQTAVRSLTDYFDPERVFIGTPPDAVLPEGLTAIIGLESMSVAETTLVSTIELHVVRIRIYRAKASGTSNAIELQRDKVIPALFDVLKGDFTLGSTIRNVDFGGQYGTPVRVDFEDEEIADKAYWTAHLTLPLIVDPVAVFVA